MIENHNVFSKLLANELKSLLEDGSVIEKSLFVTLRFNTASKGGPIESFLCDTSCRKNYDHFWNILNTHFFGRKYKTTKTKKDKYQMRHLSVLHQHKDPKRSHVHSIIVPPLDVGKQYLEQSIKRFWSKTYFGKSDFRDGWHLHICDIYSSGVIEYPIKDQTEYEAYVLGAYIGSGKDSDLIAF